MRKNILRVSAIFAFFSIWILTRTNSIGAESISIEDFLSLDKLAHGPRLEVSRDGRWLAYEREKIEIGKAGEEPKIIRSLEVLDSATNQTTIIVSGVGYREPYYGYSARWSPSGNQLAYEVMVDNGSRLFVWQPGQPSRQVSGIALGAKFSESGVCHWTSDGQHMVIRLGVEGMDPVMSSSKERPLLMARVYRFKDPLPSMPGETVVGEGESKASSSALWQVAGDLALVDIGTGNVKKLTKGNIQTQDYWISPNGRWVAYYAPQHLVPQTQQQLGELHLIDTASLEDRVIARAIGFWTTPAVRFSPDSRWLAAKPNGPRGLPGAFLFDVSEMRSRGDLVKFPDSEAEPTDKEDTLIWAKDSSAFYLVDQPPDLSQKKGAIWRIGINRDGPKKICVIDKLERIRIIPDCDGLTPLEGEPKDSLFLTARVADTDNTVVAKVALQTGAFSMLREMAANIVSGNVIGRKAAADVIYAYGSAAVPEAIAAVPLDSRPPVNLVRFAEKLSSLPPLKAEMIDYAGHDGEKLHGVLLYPAAFQRGVRYPMIVDVYGGSTATPYMLNAFGLKGLDTPLGYNSALYALHGYFVFSPSLPQRGETPMADIAETALAGINRVVADGGVDPERIGVWGQSYGGYTVLALLVQTNIFKCGVSCDGFGDLFSIYGQMTDKGAMSGIAAAEDGQLKMKVTPWENRSRYIDNSPFFRLDKVTAPLLLVHGERDSAVLPFLGDQTFVSLKRLGKTVEYVRYPGVDHTVDSGSTFEQRLDYVKRTLRWFDYWLKGKNSDPASSVGVVSLHQ